jgi:hypothetical protein
VLLKYLLFFPLTPLGFTFITWFLYAASLIAFAMIFASFLNSAKVRITPVIRSRANDIQQSSGILTMLALVLLSIVGEVIAMSPIVPGVKILLSLFSPVAFNNIVNILAEAENLKITMDYAHSEGK